MFVIHSSLVVFFFFSSRRRHTRFKCDWSSDVCSSDLCVRVEMRQLRDKPILGVLNLATGRSRYYQGEEVFEYLTPWIPTLASRVIEKRKPPYRLHPAAWQIRVLSQFAMDNTFPTPNTP